MKRDVFNIVGGMPSLKKREREREREREKVCGWWGDERYDDDDDDDDELMLNVLRCQLTY